MASSKDLITWVDSDRLPKDGLQAWQNNQAETISTTNDTNPDYINSRYNALGIWSGTAQPVNLNGSVDGTLLAFYTSISALPLSWDGNYPTGAESQSFAISIDGGAKFTRYDGNPVVPELDALLGYKEDSNFYVTLSSGIHGSGPRIPLYIAPSNDLLNWTFLGAIDEPRENVTQGDPRQVGHIGSNWEVCNFFALDGRGYQSTGGIQGGLPTFLTLWNEGNMTARENGSVQFDVMSGGAIDNGNLYAITSFNDTKNDRRIQTGWSQEGANDNFAMRQQGLQGAFSLPKILFSMETEGVVPPSNLSQVQNSIHEENDNGTWTARTLGSRAVDEVVQGLRNGSRYVQVGNLSTVGKGGSANILANMSRSYELSLTINSTTGRTGVVVAASPGFEEYTTVWFDLATQTVAFNRTHSSILEGFLNTTYEGYFEPYNLSSTNEYEAIHMHIWVDSSLVEVNINDRFWLTSRVYPRREDSVGFGMFSDDDVRVQYDSIGDWDGLYNIFPDRPMNSSSLLVFDTAAETGNYTWWQGS